MRISIGFSITPFSNSQWTTIKEGVVKVTKGSSIDWELYRDGTLIGCRFVCQIRDHGDHNKLALELSLFSYNIEATWYSHRHYGEEK